MVDFPGDPPADFTEINEPGAQQSLPFQTGRSELTEEAGFEVRTQCS